MTSPSEFMAAARAPRPLNGNSPWAAQYAGELREVVVQHAARLPRSLQKYLGPSELGHECDRQVVGKMAGEPRTNHVTDPWASIVGTALHAWFDEAFTADNVRRGVLRWLTERKVTPGPLVNNPGTADLYDALRLAVVDHKNLGDTTMGQLRSHGPPRHYRVQLLLYGLGYHVLGLDVERVVIAAWPRTKSSLDQQYVWETKFSPDDPLLAEVFRQTAEREDMADLITDGLVTLNQIPATPSDHDCYFCDFYRPQAVDGGPGCAGTKWQGYRMP